MNTPLLIPGYTPLGYKTVPIILWSGGLDSTYAVYDQLKNGKTIDLLLMDMMIEGRTVLVQEKATNRMLYEFRKLIASGQLSGKINRVIHHRISTTAIRDQAAVYGLHQVSSYFGAVTYMLQSYNSKIIIGYVKNDPTIQYIPDFKEAWRLMNKVQRLTFGQDKTAFTIDLEFPYVEKEKKDMLLELPMQIAEATTWCNVPQSAPDCGVCKNCRIMLDIFDNYRSSPGHIFSNYVELNQRYDSMKQKKF